MRRSAFILILAGLLATEAANNAAAQSAPLACGGAEQPRLVAELLFGRDIGSRIGVSETAWRDFVARQITPRFPDGLTVIPAMGQWRDPASKRIVREPSRLVMIVLPGNSDDQLRLAAVVAAYKRRFHQHSVGLIVQSACAAF
jgi:hypothetical protein